MNGNRTGVAAMTIAVLLLSAGCARDLARLKIANYVNQDILTIAELEQKPLEVYAAVTGERFTSDQAVYEALNDFVIPYYGRFLNALRNIRPQTDEIDRLHAIYLKGAESIYSGFRMKLAGIASRDVAVIQAANRRIQAGSEQTARWRRELEALYRKYEIGTR